MANLELKNNLITLTTGKSDSNSYNLMLSSLKNDLNELFQETANIQNSVDNYLVLFNDEQVEQLIFKVQRLQQKYENYANLLRNTDYSSLISYDFSSLTERLQLIQSNVTSQALYRDPKDPSVKFTSDSYCLINTNTHCLQLPVKQSNEISINNTVLNYDNQVDGNTISNAYFIRSTTTPIEVDVILNLQKETLISYLSFTPQSYYPFNIKSISYHNGTIWQSIPGTSRTGVYGNTQILFPVVSTSILKIEIELTSCKATNQTVDYSVNALTQTLLRQAGMYGTLDNPGQETYDYYIFNLGISDFSAGRNDKQNTGIFVGIPVTLKEPAHFNLNTTENNNINNSITAEYYLYKKDFDSKGTVLNADLVPVLPYGKDTIFEVLKFVTKDKISVAALNFFPQGDLTNITIYKNGVTATEVFQLNGNEIIYPSSDYTSSGDSTGAIYTVKYKPYFKNKTYPVPVNNPIKNITKTVDLNPDSDNIDYTNNTLKLYLPYTFDPATVTVQRLYGGTPDVNAPVIKQTNNQSSHSYNSDGQCWSLTGRVLTIGYDLKSYPKLEGATYRITGHLYGSSLEDDELYYYTSDNSLIVNWNAFGGLKDYDHSELNLVIIIRQILSSSENEFNISNVNLYSNNFNEMLSTITNLTGV